MQVGHQPPPPPPPPPSLMHVTFTLIPGKQRKRQEFGYFWGCHWHWTWPNSLQPRYQFLITNGFADVPLRIENLFTAMPVIDTVKGRKARKTTAFQELQKKKSWIILNQRICFFTLFHMIKKTLIFIKSLQSEGIKLMCLRLNGQVLLYSHILQSNLFNRVIDK